MGVVIEGAEQLNRKFRSLEDANAFFHPVVEDVALKMLQEVKKNTPRDKLNPAPHTDVMWKAKNLGNSLFAVENEKVTQDGKHAVASILNHGRKEVKPVKAKKLYIPISRAAKRKKLGAPIPNGLKWGTDFVLTDKSRAVPGTKFIDEAEKNAQKNLRNGIAKKIREVFK